MDLSHVDEHGHARMVDISEKSANARSATAGGFVRMSSDAVQAIKANALAKGDARGVARVAGILAAKRVDELIPLCHTLALSDVAVEFEIETHGVRITATASTVAQTGVEMEALTAVSVAALTIYDMVKAVDKRMAIEEVRLLKKTGGKSGDFFWDPSE